jgi:sugar/nucleoside kinase (ribokinase family)
VGISPSTSLSITSPSQVPWKVLERAKSVYIGEIFVEVASSIAANAKANGIPVFYRCSIPFWELGLERLKPVLSQVDILLISHRAWNYLKKTLKPNPIRRIQRITDALLLIREAANKYRLVEGETQQFVECDNGTNELSEWVVAGIMQKSVDGFTIPKALEDSIKDETTRLATG